MVRLFALSLLLGMFWLGAMVGLAPGAIAAPYRPIAPADGTEILKGNQRGDVWVKASAAAQFAYCQDAFAAFRASPAQSYIISHNVQSLTSAGLCERINQFYAVEDNRETRIGAAAAIAPLLFADTPLDAPKGLSGS